MWWNGNIALAVAVIGCAPLSMAADTAGTPIGKQVGDFSLPIFTASPHSLSQYQDRAVVLAFLGTECPLVKKYGPRLRDLAAEFAQAGVVFLGIDANLQDTLTEIGAFVRVNGITFPMLKDNNNELADRLGTIRTPEVFLLDRQHVIRYWGRIDDQYGSSPEPDTPSEADRALPGQAIGEVLAGSKSANRRQSRRLLDRSRGQRAPHGAVTTQPGGAHFSEPSFTLPSPGRIGPSP